MYQRAKKLLSPHLPFGQKPILFDPEVFGEIKPPDEVNEQYILRMMVKRPDTDWKIPTELSWLSNTIEQCIKLQEMSKIPVNFVYVTVRHGIVKSVTDDMWHVDGFSMRTPHAPEQNYIWANNHPTEILNQEVRLPPDFDPMKHNIHEFFQDVADLKNIRKLTAGVVAGIDPYVIHRRPQIPDGTHRTFFRISFVPIEIEDDTCTINPLIPREKPYGREDIRKRLVRYENAKEINALLSKWHLRREMGAHAVASLEEVENLLRLKA